MSRSITIGPAYGRDYPSKAKALADWDANKDFTIHDMFLRGSYVNKQQVADLKRDGITSVHIRYHMMTKVVVIKL
jgi:hypothetical protein